MPAAVRVKISTQAVRDLLRSDEVLEDLRQRAERIAAEAGPGMVVDADVGTNRARAVVITGDAEAMLAEAETRALTRAISAGR